MLSRLAALANSLLLVHEEHFRVYVLRHRAERHAPLVELLREVCEVGDGARETVDLVDDYDVLLGLPDGVEWRFGNGTTIEAKETCRQLISMRLLAVSCILAVGDSLLE